MRIWRSFHADSSQHLSARRFLYTQHPNFYLIHNERGTIIVDAGTVPEDLERAEAQLSVWEIFLEKVDYLFLTHNHYALSILD